MRTHVSVLALATALLASSPAMAQLSLDTGVGVDVNVGGDTGLDVDAGVSVGGDSGVNVDAGANVGGDSGVNVDAGVGVGGDSGVDVDANVGIGGSDGDGGSGLDVDVDAGTGGTGGVGVDVDLGTDGGTTGPNGGTLIDLAPAGDVLDVEVGTSGTAGSGGTEGTGIRISALDESVRVDVLLDQIADPQLAEVDLDALVDDRRVTIVAAADLLGTEDLAQIELAIEANPDGRTELLDAIAESEVLTSVLNNAGIAPEDVLSVSIAGDGSTEVVILGGSGTDLATVDAEVLTDDAVADVDVSLLPGTDAGTGGTETDLASLDVNLLTDEELAEIDLALLPSEEQRVDAVLRILATDGGDGTDDSGTTRIVDLNAILGTDALQDVTDTLGTDVAPELDAELTARLEALGLDPTAVVAIGSDAGGDELVFVDTSITLGAGTDTGGGDTGGTDGGTGGGTDTGNDGTGTDDGNGTGGTGGDGNSGTDDGAGTDDGTGTPGNGSGGTPDAGAGAGGSGDSDDDGDSPATGNGDGTGTDDDDGADVASADIDTAVGTELDTINLFADLNCEVGVNTLVSATTPSPEAIARASDLELVRLIGCEQPPRAGDVEGLREAIEGHASLLDALQDAGVSVEQVVGATMSGTVVTVYVHDPLLDETAA